MSNPSERLSLRVQRIKPSATLAITARAKALKAEGKDIIGLGAGEPDFDTPQHIKQAAIEAINNGFTKYTAVDGIIELKHAIMDKFQRDNQLSYQANQILVSCGGKHSFYNVAAALLQPGDQAIIPAPYWVSYTDIVLLANGDPVVLQTTPEDGFKITPEQLEQAINDKTRLFVLNSPSNPTGAMYTREELAALGEVLKAHPQVMIVSDDIYEHILLSDQAFVNILNVCPELTDRTIVLNGVSKAYSMTGWRIGYAAGPAWLIQAMKNIQSQCTSNPASISQAAAVAALTGDQGCMDDMVTQFRLRHEFIVDALNQVNGLRCIRSTGAFYTFADCQEAIRQLDAVNDDVTFAEYLINKVGVAMVPGSAFGAKNFMRLSFATSMENLEQAVQRLSDLLS